jgi:hypothetical protein
MSSDILGVDIGGVLIERVADNTDTSFFSDRFLDTPSVPEAFETLSRLSRARFGENIHLVSKCGPRTEEKTKLWLAHHRFAEITGIPPERVHFCRARQDKAPICEGLGITHFVDDRLEVLGYLTTVRRRYLFRPDEAEMAKHARHLPGVIVVRSWSAIATDLL